MMMKLICRVLGHSWRRPHKKETVRVDCRICDRCGAARPVTKRKAKA